MWYNLYFEILEGRQLRMTTKPTTNTASNQGGFFNLLMRKPAITPKAQTASRRIICKEEISSKEREAVVKLYDVLVPGDNTRTVNVNMIIEEGFPAFEATIGEANFNKVKKFYGIGCRPSKNGIKEKDIQDLVNQLRTVENAQYYIDGYKELLEMMAAKLCGAPEEMTMLEKAKFVRMYYTIFVGYYFFAQDFKRSYNFSTGTYFLEVDFPKAIKNNSMAFRPEDLFYINKVLIDFTPANTLVYDLIFFEFARLDKKLIKEILQFAELRSDENGQLVSVNIAPKYQTFSTIRNIKYKVHPEIGVYPMEIFACTTKMKEALFDDLYQLYKILRVKPLESFRLYTQKESYIEGSREVLKDRTYYEVAENFSVSGQVEIDRFLRMIEYMAGTGFTLKTSEGKECDMGLYMSAFNFLHAMKYIDVTIDPKKEFEFAELLLQMDTTGVFLAYKNKEITEEDVKARLGIDSRFEEKHFGIARTMTPEEAAIEFAVNNMYVESEADISKELFENVIMSGNEMHFKKLATGEIDEETLKSKIGFEEEFAEMYFSLSKVDISAVEARLQELKRTMAKKGEMKKSALLISLYCFLIEEEVPCGAKMKAPKRNKGLKPANLKAQIE